MNLLWESETTLALHAAARETEIHCSVGLVAGQLYTAARRVFSIAIPVQCLKTFHCKIAETVSNRSNPCCEVLFVLSECSDQLTAHVVSAFK